MSHLFAPRFLKLIVLPPLLFAILAYATVDKALVIILNVMLTAVSFAAAVAFTPEVYKIVYNNLPMTRASYLAYGIWVSWSVNVYGALLSIIWRFSGEPSWVPNSDLTSIRLFMLCVAGACHIVKPSGLTDNVPTREAVRIGIILGAAFGLGLAMMNLPEIYAAWHGYKVPSLWREYMPN